ncbi:MAG: hypothetical protein AAF975_02245 [Spirochaetota bacterium]
MTHQNNLEVFQSIPLAALIREEIQAVPDGVWLELKAQGAEPLQVSRYQLSSGAPHQGKFKLYSQQQLTETKSVVLAPSQFFQVTGNGNAGGTAEFSSIPNLYFNKKFNAGNGLGQPHSEVAYFKAYYSHLHPEHGKRPLDVLDLGCGRGRNAVVFAGDARQDYRVLGLEQSGPSLAVWHSLGLGDKLASQQVDLNTWREAPSHDIAMAIVSLQFIQKAEELLLHCMERANNGALHLSVFPIASAHPAVVWPAGFAFLPQSDEVKNLYIQQGWSILEYRESYGHLGKIAGDGLPLRGLFATLIAQKQY